MRVAAGPTNAPAIGFLSFTNSSQGKQAVLWFTNFAKADVAVVPLFFEQVQTNGTWTSNSFLTARSRLANVWRRSWVGLREEVAAGQGFIFSVPLPTNGLPFRITFNCGERAPATDLIRDVVRHATATNAVMASSKIFTGPRHVVRTPEIRE